MSGWEFAGSFDERAFRQLLEADPDARRCARAVLRGFADLEDVVSCFRAGLAPTVEAPPAGGGGGTVSGSASPPPPDHRQAFEETYRALTTASARAAAQLIAGRRGAGAHGQLRGRARVAEAGR